MFMTGRSCGVVQIGIRPSCDAECPFSVKSMNIHKIKQHTGLYVGLPRFMLHILILS